MVTSEDAERLFDETIKSLGGDDAMADYFKQAYNWDDFTGLKQELVSKIFRNDLLISLEVWAQVYLGCDNQPMSEATKLVWLQVAKNLGLSKANPPNPQDLGN